MLKIVKGGKFQTLKGNIKCFLKNEKILLSGEFQTLKGNIKSPTQEVGEKRLESFKP